GGMGAETLGYASMVPLGYSYTLGQWVLHGPIPADPSDPSLPDPAYVDAVFEACLGVNIARAEWLAADASAFHAAALADIAGRSPPVPLSSIKGLEGMPALDSGRIR